MSDPALEAPAEATPDPSLVEHLRRRAARDARVGGADVTREDLADLVRDMVAEERRILTAAGRDALVEAVVDEALGLGPLEALLRDPDVTEVMVCGPARVFVERAGRIAPAPTRFHDDAHLLHVIDRILDALAERGAGDRAALVVSAGPERGEIAARALGRALATGVVGDLPWARREGADLSAGRWSSGRGRRLHHAVERLAEAIG